MSFVFWTRWSLKDLSFLLVTLALIAFLGLAARLLPDVSNAGVLMLWLLVAAALTVPLLWKARRKRRGVLKAFVRPRSPLYRWLRGGVLMLLLRFSLALVLSAVLLTGLARMEAVALFWLALLLAPLWVKLHGLVRGRLVHHVQRYFLVYITAQWLFWGTGMGVLVAIGILGFYTPVPDLQEVELASALAWSTRQVSVYSPWLGELLALLTVLETTLYWLAQNLARDTIWLLKLLIWGILILRDWLFIWPLLLLLQLGYIGVYDRDRHRHEHRD
ncbi:hypothetical protein [Marinimicrobium alkaliphilum]|uniref:hypothetical protein n=1 Tax=Marinimicrobium alkaliphilum TaxID=2202654 RepID=UPI0013002D4F|nr:hypothetical protein [Marinimicrobium alkaliphilum]